MHSSSSGCWFSRTPSQWALIAVMAALGLFYASLIVVWRSETFSEAYHRTFISREFFVYPEATGFNGIDGLTYVPGTTVEIAEQRARWYLARTGWWRFNQPAPYLKGQEGHLYLHIAPAELASAGALHLRMEFTCALPDGVSYPLRIRLDGQPVGEATCAQGQVIIEGTLPTPRLSASAYRQILVERDISGLGERLATRVGLRFAALSLDRFRLTTTP